MTYTPKPSTGLLRVEIGHGWKVHGASVTLSQNLWDAMTPEEQRRIEREVDSLSILGTPPMELS